MNPIDQRHKLDEEPFSYQTSKDGKLFIYWHGKQVMILKDEKAKKLLTQLTHSDPSKVQLTLAKVTGNFKRGNER